MMLESREESLYQNFPSDIGLYYSQIHDQSKESNKKASEWFEKAYKMKKTKASINNYGMCYLKGFGVVKDIKKAEEIFRDGVSIGDKNSMYHLSFILNHHIKI